MKKYLPLNAATLPVLGKRVDIPRYCRAELTAGVVHLGVGNFHRAHQAMYFDRLAELGVKDWGVTGIGLRSRAVRDALAPQDNLFLVVSRDSGAPQARVVGSLLDCLYAPDQPSLALAALSSPRTRLVTLTITGNGYPHDGGGSQLEPREQHDLEHPGSPTTTFGYLAEALDKRRLSGAGGMTVLSCDNLPDSGATTKAATLAYARRRGPELVRWIEDQVRFPNAMVDRITPATTREERRFVRDRFHVADRWPVVTESFSQWVVEDSFTDRRPPLDEVGVQFVSDVSPYKLVKTRLLNGGHCALGYLGVLSGYASSSEAMQDHLIRSVLERLLRDEVAPLLSCLPSIELPEYCGTILERFSNPHIADPLARLSGRGSTKMPAYLLPSLHEARRRGRPHAVLTLVVAAWMRYLRGSTPDGQSFVIQDAHATHLQELALEGGSNPRPLLSRTDLFGDLGEDSFFVQAVEAVLVRLDRLGMRAALSSCLPRGNRAALLVPNAMNGSRELEGNYLAAS